MGGAQKEAKKFAPKKTKESQKARKCRGATLSNAEKEELTMHWMNINGVQQFVIGLPGESAADIARKRDLNATCMLGREEALRELTRVPTIGCEMASRLIARGLERPYDNWLDVKSLSGVSSQRALSIRKFFSLPCDF